MAVTVHGDCFGKAAVLFPGIPKLWNSGVSGFGGNGFTAVMVNAVDMR